MNQQKQFDSGDTFNKYSFLSLYLYNDDGECSCELENLFRQLEFRVEKILIWWQTWITFFVDTFLSEQGSKSADVRVAFWSKNSSAILYSTIWRSYMFCKYGFEKLVFCLEFIAKRNKVRGNRVNFQGPQRIYFNILSSAHFLVASNWGKSSQKKMRSCCTYI